MKHIVYFVCILMFLSSCSFNATKPSRYVAQTEFDYSCSVAWASDSLPGIAGAPMKLAGSNCYVVTSEYPASNVMPVVKFDLDTGSIVWKSSADLVTIKSVEVLGNTVYAIANSGMYCLNATTGALEASVMFDADADIAWQNP